MNKITEAIELHDTLNPILWDANNNLKEEVLDKLLDIYYEFIKFIELPLNVVDVEIVGSNASYNYNENSDIDLHIIVNFDLNYVDNDILQQLYNSKKNSFNENYDIDIEGIPVELYIEDVNAGNATNGRYSIIENSWLLIPEKIKYTIPDISDSLQKWIDICNDCINSNDAEQIKEVINQIYMMRKISLAESGEAGIGNLVFKELRSNGFIQQLRDKYYEIRSEILSL